MVDALKKILQIAEKEIIKSLKQKIMSRYLIKFIRSYLKERKIKINNTEMEIRTGVQQGPLVLSFATVNCWVSRFSKYRISWWSWVTDRRRHWILIANKAIDIVVRGRMEERKLGKKTTLHSLSRTVLQDLASNWCPWTYSWWKRNVRFRCHVQQLKQRRLLRPWKTDS